MCICVQVVSVFENLHQGRILCATAGGENMLLTGGDSTVCTYLCSQDWASRCLVLSMWIYHVLFVCVLFLTILLLGYWVYIWVAGLPFYAALPVCYTHAPYIILFRQRVTHDCASILDSIAMRTNCFTNFHVVHPYIPIHSVE